MMQPPQFLKSIIRHSSDAPRDSRVVALASKDKEAVIAAVETLVREREGSSAEEELLAIADNWEEDETFAPLWSMVILGRIGSRRAIPFLLQILDSDAEIWQEAAAEALSHIAQKHGEEALYPLERFIEDRLDHDPFSARLFAYEPFATMFSSEYAKRFLISMFELDMRWRDSLANDLAGFGDKRILHLIRRAIEFARQSRDEIAEREFLYAYCILDGAYQEPRDSALWRKPWQERWERHLNMLGKSDAEIEEMDSMRFQGRLANDQEIIQKARADDAMMRRHRLCEFDIAAYLSVRERTTVEDDFDAALRLLGLSGKLSVEDVQRMIFEASRPDDIIAGITGEYFSFSSADALEEFRECLYALWDVTPRKELSGLTSEEVAALPRAKRINDYFSKNMEKLKEKFFHNDDDHDPGVTAPNCDFVGRNDKCFCGSGKKYKRCHGA